MDLIIRDAHVLTFDSEDRELEHADILIQDGRIISVEPTFRDQDIPIADRVIDATGKLAIPGLINGHFHSPGNFMKGAVANQPLELFMLYEVPPFMDGPVSARFAYIRTAIGILEMLKQGVTTVHDDAFFLPVPTDAEIDSVMSAYMDSGMRATVALDQQNVVEYEKYPFLKEIISDSTRERMEQAPRMTDGELLKCYEDFVERWDGAGDGRLRVGVSCSAPHRVTPAYLKGLGSLALRFDMPFNMHILETRLQRVFGDEVLKRSLVRYAHEMGVLNQQAQVIHAIWVDEEDIRLLSDSGCSVAHNPVANLKLGSGVMPFRRLREAGINICLGSDEATVHDGVNLWSVAKTAGLIHNITDPEYRNWPGPNEILHALTTGGARAMRQADRLGRIAKGFCADIALLDLDALAFSPLNDLKHQLVYCETGASVVMTIVDGRVVMEKGRVLTLDEAAIKAEARDLAQEFTRFMGDTESGVKKLAGSYREMYVRSLDKPVGMNRWVGPVSD